MPTEGDTELQRYYLQQLKELKQKIDLRQPSEDSSGSIPTPSNNKSAQERETYFDSIDIKAMIRATPRPVPSPYIKERGDRHHAKFISILFKLNSPAQSQNKKPRTK